MAPSIRRLARSWETTTARVTQAKTWEHSRILFTAACTRTAHPFGVAPMPRPPTFPRLSLYVSHSPGSLEMSLILMSSQINAKRLHTGFNNEIILHTLVLTTTVANTSVAPRLVTIGSAGIDVKLKFVAVNVHVLLHTSTLLQYFPKTRASLRVGRLPLFSVPLTRWLSWLG